MASAQSAGFGQALTSRKLVDKREAMGLPQESARSFNSSDANSFSGNNNSMFQQDMQRGAQLMMSGGYQIHILGQVSSPGTYRLPPSTRMAEAINVAGGIVERGSQRNIEVRRKKSSKKYDLLKFETVGDLRQNPFLLDNDVIFVPYSERNVQIQGPVKSSGEFQLSSREKSVEDLVKLAGGFTPGVAYQDSVKVIRYENGIKQLLSIQSNSKELSSFELLNGDIVVIPHVLASGRTFDYDVAQLPADNVFYPSYNDNIFVLGSVTLPGAYKFNPHFQIKDFVNMAGPKKDAGVNKVYVVTAAGERVRIRRNQIDYKVSPGDTIVVPERHFSYDKVLDGYKTVTGSLISGLTAWFLIQRIDN